MSAKRLIIVGMGSIGLRHAGLYSSLPHLRVEVCDAREEGLAEARAIIPTVPTWNDYAAALDSQPDYVLIATPHQMHADMACLALEKGVRVLCEKPMSHRLDEAARMVDASRTTGTPLAVGFHLRFHPSIVLLKAMLDSGEAGKLLFARYRVDSLVTLENSRSRYQAHLPGALLMDYSHGLDLLAYLFATMTADVHARGIPGSIEGFSANPLIISAILAYADFQVELHLSYTGKPEVHCLELVTSKYNIRLELNGSTFIRHRISDGRAEDLSPEYERNRLYLAQWQAFEEFCAGHPTSVCTADQAVEVNRTMAALLETLNIHSGTESPHLHSNRA